MSFGKRLICVLLTTILFLSFCPSLSHADTSSSAFFLQSAYVARYGETATVQARISNGQVQNWTLQTADGTTLGSVRAGGRDNMISFVFPVTSDFPRLSILRLFCEEREEYLCEAPLVCDQPQNGGIRQVATDRRAVAITFDTASAAGKVYQILDLLDQYHAKATFFMIGIYAIYNPNEAKEIAARGHEIASHSYEHLAMSESAPEDIFKSLNQADQLLRTINGNKTVHYRPPSGISVFADRAVAHALGAEVILWSIDSGDGFSYVSESGVRLRVKGALHNGGIVLMHVYGHHTLNALKVLLPYYAEQGYSFVTVADLLLGGDTYTDAFGTQRSLHHSDAQIAPIAERLKDGR